MKIFRKVTVIIVCFTSFLVYAAYNQNSKFPNELSPVNQFPVFPHNSALPHQVPQGVQVIKSSLGLEVKFLHGNVSYPGPAVINDPRYKALTLNEKLVDALKFQPMQSPPFLLLVAIAKNPTGEAIIVPGKFDVVDKTEQGGFVLKDTHDRLFYYSGYVLTTPAWGSLAPGQTLRDKFCKKPVPMVMCPNGSVVNIMLKKPLDSAKDIPLLAFIQ
ncbi:MAG: hypothetical protein K0R52_343 [Alphaproteobacteria bacterium]|jgi:hypothetical protein|nr:hypothetical protein [Alphaproteobacteria bacterium]